MKLKRLQKKLLIHLTAVLAIICVLGGGYWWLTSIEEDTGREKKILLQKVTNVNKEIQDLRDQYIKATASLGLYESLQAESNQPDKALSRKNGQRILEELSKRYQLSRLTIKMEPVEVLKDQRFQKKTTVTQHSEVTLKFAGLTDEYIFSFIDALTNELSGYVRIEQLSLKRDYQLNNETLLKVSKGEIPALVSGEMKFHWLGLKSIEDSEAEEKDN